ncbi:MAG TPA: hypothetical protein PKI11_02635 [Candidatus Hydrogenedentes bacterium]|nr:hypothetical protein [Candidatus Hydrogenedentota bacterium]HNT88580.1 hypothetical protein [Candidatus Hydrogenedentota bacterium]
MSRIPRIKNILYRCAAALCSALVFSACPSSPAPDAAASLYERDVSAGIHDITPLRGERGPLRLHVDDDAFECSGCHDGFSGDLSEAAIEGEHKNIVFAHGRNLLCLNCHHPENSDVYLDHGGGEIPGDQPTLLCAKCHGPHYREWEHGVHGRVNHFWDARFGPEKNLDCIQCHDPHHPRIPEMKPEPPPVLTRFDHPAKGDSAHEPGA